MNILGIDPGASGGLALLVGDDCYAIKMPETERDAWLYLKEANPDYVFIERVHSMPKQGVASSFKFGQSYGFLRGLLIAGEFPFEEVAPQKWQKAMGCLSKGDKNVTKARAQQLRPKLRITHAVADAVILAEYGSRMMASRTITKVDTK